MNLRPWRKSEEKRGLSDDALIDLAFGFSGLKNVFNVTQDNAIKSTAVVACLIVRAETFASLPVHVYRTTGDRRAVVSGHPLDRIVGREWNPLMTSIEGWRWKQITEDIRGNAFVRIERRNGQPLHFWPLTNKDIVPRWTGDRLVYDYAGDSLTRKDTYSGADIIHFKGPLVKDAWSGTSLVDQASIAIGLTIQAERFYERLLGKGNHFPGWLETDSALKKEDVLKLGENMAALAGIDHAGETRIFDRGLKYKTTAMNVVEADLTAQQLWYLQEVCRIFRVPPMLVQDYSRSTYSNSEQGDLAFAKYTVLPISVNTEKTIARLFTARNEDDHYIKFAIDGLLRGEFATRMEGYASAITQGCFMTRNEARKLEDLDPIDGLDEALVPLNMAGVNDPVPDPSARDLSPLLVDARERITTRRAQDEERGRTTDDTRRFAELVIAPLVASGVIEDPDDFISQTIGGTS